MTNIIAFPRTKIDPVLLEAYNDIKVRLIDYFEVDSIQNLKIVPANPACVTEVFLLDLCQIIRTTPADEKLDKVAEKLFSLRELDTTLEELINKIMADDLILGCFAAEIQKLEDVERLYLVNILKGVYPDQGAAIQSLKLCIFSRNMKAPAVASIA